MPLQQLDYQARQPGKCAAFVARWKSKLTLRRVVTVAVLYTVTWIGGRYTYSRDLHRYAESLRARGQRLEADENAFASKNGLPLRSRELFSVPRAEVNWCFPLLPGVLVADSEYVIAPLWGEGGMKIVIYYGFGTIAIPINNWRS
jgi:hypothetical protein